MELKELTEVALQLVGWKGTWFKEFCQHGPVWFETLCGVNWVYLWENGTTWGFSWRNIEIVVSSLDLSGLELDSCRNRTTEIEGCVQLDPRALQFHWSLFPGGRMYHIMTVNLSRNEPEERKTHLNRLDVSTNMFNHFAASSYLGGEKKVFRQRRKELRLQCVLWFAV